MLITSMNRYDLVHLLPRNGKVAEIGVAEGEFSRHLLAAGQSELHLIDPWETQEGDYSEDPNNVDKSTQDTRYENIVASFRSEIEKKSVFVHRMYSSDAVKNFADGELDWVYIDGDHTYDGVYRDLVSYAPKVSDEGFICGHDYTNHAVARSYKFGVVDAVNHFVLEYGYYVLAMTLENWPTYIIAKNATSASSRAIVGGIIRHSNFVVDVENYPTHGSFQHLIYVDGEKKILVPRFTLT